MGPRILGQLLFTMSQSQPPRRSPASDPQRGPPSPSGPRAQPPPAGTPPLSDDGLEAAKKRDAEEATGATGAKSPREGPGVGGDPAVESGRPEHDPERPKQDLRTPPM